jgi:hypothetical protein
MFRAVLLAAAISTYSSSALAGGSAEPVRVISLSISDETNYVLVVAPEPTQSVGGYSDPYFGQCERFEVRGTFARLKGAWPWTNTNLNRRAHLDALAYLTNAKRTGQVVQFGWMGNGFVAVDAKIPCVVKSRALQVLVDRGNTMVISYHDVV